MSGAEHREKIEGVSSRCLYQERVINKNRNHILTINYMFYGNFRASPFELYKKRLLHRLLIKVQKPTNKLEVES